MRVDMSNLMESEVKGVKDLDELTEVVYPTGVDFMTKRELLAKLCELEFRLNGTWTEEFLEEFESKLRDMNVNELAKALGDKLEEIYQWDDAAYLKAL